MSSKAFVTGATGMLGSHLVEELVKQGWDVRALARTSSCREVLKNISVEWVTGDLSDFHSFENALAGIDVVFHSAALMRDWAPQEDYEKHNVQATKNLLRAAIKKGVSRVLHVSTRSVLGMEECSELKENAPYRASNQYGASKIAAEKAVLEAHRQGQIDCTVLRPTWIVGPRDRYSLPTVVAFLKKGQLTLINQGRALQSFVHPLDVVQALILAAVNPQARGQIYLIDSGERRTIREFTEILSRAVGAEMPHKSLPYPLAYGIGWVMETLARIRGTEKAPRLTTLRVKLLGQNHSYDITKARQELGYMPRMNLEESVKSAVKFLEGQHP